MMRRWGLSLVLAVTLGSWCGTVHALSASDKEALRQLSDDAATEYDEGLYGSALEKFQRAYSIAKVPTFAVWLARTNEKLRRLVIASELYQEALNLQPNDLWKGNKQQEAQKEAKTKVGQLRQVIPRLLIVVEGAAVNDIAVTIDDVTVPSALIGVERPADPGVRLIVARRGDEIKRETVTLAERDKKTVTIKFDKPALPAAVGNAPSAGVTLPPPIATPPTMAARPTSAPFPPPPPLAPASASPQLPPSNASAPLNGVGPNAMTQSPAPSPYVYPVTPPPPNQAAPVATTTVQQGSDASIANTAKAQDEAEAEESGSSGQSAWGWAGIGIGAAGLGVGITGAIVVAVTRSQLQSHGCTGNTCVGVDRFQNSVNSYNTWRNVSTAGFIVGGIGTVTGVALLLATPRHQSSGSVGLHIGPGTVSLRGAF